MGMSAALTTPRGGLNNSGKLVLLPVVKKRSKRAGSSASTGSGGGGGAGGSSSNGGSGSGFGIGASHKRTPSSMSGRFSVRSTSSKP